MNPSDQFKNGLPTIADGIFVPAGYVTSNNYIVNRILNTTWTGAKWSVSSNLGLAAGFYIQWQPSYLPAPGVCAGSGINTSSSKCAGTRDAMSFMIDYKPTARIDIYAGMMVSQVTGGFASGFLYTRNVDPTVGLRVRF